MLPYVLQRNWVVQEIFSLFSTLHMNPWAIFFNCHNDLDFWPQPKQNQVILESNSMRWNSINVFQRLLVEKNDRLTLHLSLCPPRPVEAAGKGYWKLVWTCSPSAQKRPESTPPPVTEEAWKWAFKDRRQSKSNFCKPIKEKLLTVTL